MRASGTTQVCSTPTATAQLPALYGILDRYDESPEPAEQRIAVAVKSMIAELEQERDE